MVEFYTKKYLLFTFLLIISINVSAQKWVEMMQNKTSNFYDIQKEFNEYWKDSSYTTFVEMPQSSTIQKKLPGWKVFKRWEYFMEPRLYPSGNFSVMNEALIDYMNENYFQSTRSENPSVPSILAGNWSFVGPANPPSSSGQGAGRLNFVRFDPSNSSTIYVGAASGGLWKSTNGGTSWTTNTDNLAVIGCTDLAINPSNTQIMYLATGDGYGTDTYSVGVLKSTNGGTSWSTTGLNWTVTSTRTIRRLIINPQNPNTLFAATSAGIYRTRNAGTTWSSISTGSFYDIEFKPGDTTTIYACSSDRVYKSTNAGTSFTNITSGLPASTSVSRMSLAVTPANANYVYVLAGDNSYGYNGLYKSTNSATSFTASSTSPNILGWSSSGTGAGGQAWYDLALAASPTNAEHIFVGGINIWSSTNGGTSWTNQAYWATSGTKYVHADVHDLQFLPGNGTTVFAATDGAIFKTSNSGTVWNIISNGLGIAQIYRIGLSAQNANVFLTGWQDNGTNKFSGGTIWDEVVGGDGMECIVDWSNSNIQYGSLYYGEIKKTTTGGYLSSSFVNSGGTGVHEDGAWVTPYIQSPTNAQTFFVGKSQVYRTTNNGSSWSTVGSISGGTGKLVALAVAPSNGNYIYAAKSNKIYACTNGSSFTDVTTGLPVTSAAITYIAVHPTNPSKVWVTLSGYSSGNKVYYSTNAGTSWTNYSTGLPNLPVNCIVIDKNSTNESIYVGTDVGAYYRNNTQSSWVSYSTGLPNVIVNELEIQYNTQKIRAATYGRGVWESPLNGASGVGIESIQNAKNVIISPNPNNGSFILSIDNVMKENFQVEIYNSVGQLVSKEKINPNSGNIVKEYNLIEYGKGIYFITLFSDNAKFTEKVIIY